LFERLDISSLFSDDPPFMIVGRQGNGIDQALTGEFTGVSRRRLINTITLPTADHKGRIIGKEGRNIKTLEQLLGVDIIIDETPGVIVVSSFNLYRRAIATRVIELLVQDGRIHPGRIVVVSNPVSSWLESSCHSAGEFPSSKKRW